MRQPQNFLAEIIATLPDGRPRQVCIGLHWTAVAIEVDGELRCGLASTLGGIHQHGTADVPEAGDLETIPALELANMVFAEQPTLVSVGMATINALQPQEPARWVNLNAEEVIAERGNGRRVVLVGHFPFIPRLAERVGKLTVLELNPGPGDLPVSEAQNVIPEADVVAITGMTLLNRTLDGLLNLCRPDAHVILLGPSVPLSPLFFSQGIDLLCGSIVTDIEAVLRCIRHGGNFRQVHKAGVHLVTIARPEVRP